MNIFVINGYIAKIFIKPLTKGFLLFFQSDMGISCGLKERWHIPCKTKNAAPSKLRQCRLARVSDGGL